MMPIMATTIDVRSEAITLHFIWWRVASKYLQPASNQQPKGTMPDYALDCLIT
jgi:hypothetical protein